MVLMESEQKLQKGDKAPDFSLKGTDGKIHSLSDYSGKKSVVIIFMCNHCPYVIHKLEVMKNLYSRYSKQDVAFIAINSNNHPDYIEDDFEHMQKFVSENEFKFDYLFDENQSVAKAYGAVCTPDPFVLDTDLRLVYHGRIDNIHYPKEEEPNTHELADVLDALIKGLAVDIEQLPSMGCSIKWRA
jgi:peroxiredoxin